MGAADLAVNGTSAVVRPIFAGRVTPTQVLASLLFAFAVLLSIAFVLRSLSSSRVAATRMGR